MRTAIVSDLHLGAASEADLLSRPEAFGVLADAIKGVDRLVLLGDVLEFRDRPFTEAMDIAKPTLAKLAALSAGEVIIVPGNHDYRLISSWLEARALREARPLRLADKARLDLWPATELRAAMPGAKLKINYPGVWLRKDVYATHGHYLDRHLTIPTFERLGLALVERTLGLAPTGDDPLAPPDVESSDEPEEYERVTAPVYAFLYALAQAGASTNHPGGTPTKRIWDSLTGGGSRSAKVRGWLLGSVALPGAVGVANRLGLGPVRADLSPNAITRAGVDAMSEVVERLRIDAKWVVFGHTHRRGPLPNEDAWVTKNGATLLNTGSWVHSPSLLRSSSKGSAYWPGTIAMIEDDGDPELIHLLDEWTREDLEDMSPAVRQITSILLIVLGGVALVGGILERYADRNLLDPERFAERAVLVLDDEGAQAEIADVVVNELEKSGLDRSKTQKAVNKNIAEITQSPQFRAALVEALVLANEAALGKLEEDVNVRVENVGGPIVDALDETPELARQIQRDVDLAIVNTGSAEALVAVARKADDLSGLSLVLPILGGLLMIGGVIVANDRRTAVFGAAMGVALAGVAIFAGYIAGREIAARQPDDDAAQDAARAIWDAVFGGLETLGLVMAGAGALVALIAGVANRVRVPGRE